MRKIAKLQYTTLVEIIYNGDTLPPNADGFQYLDITDLVPEPPIGYIYGGDGNFSRAGRFIPTIDFRNRFTPQEKVAIDNHAFNPNLTIEQHAILNTMLADISAVIEIDTSRQDVHDGVYFLESCGLIAPGRAAEILG